MKEFLKSFLRSLARFFAYFLIMLLLSLLVKSCDVKAANLPIYVHNLEYNNWSLLNGNWNSFLLGNRNINFGYMLDSSLSDRWVYNSLVICADTTFQGGIIPSGYNGYIRNISYNHTPYTCSYNSSSYTGKVVLVNFQTYFSSESGGTFDGYFTVYQDVNASIQLIDFVVNSNNYVSADNYASQSLINQNSQIINQNTTIINQNQETNDKLDETNENLDDIESAITDDTPPDLDGLNDSAGWLPAGPIDSILNLPLALLNNLTDNLSDTCQPISLPLPYVDEDITLPCLNTIYSEIDGLNAWITTIGTIASAFMLFTYFMKLYKWVDDTLTLRENNYIDNWGGI